MVGGRGRERGGEEEKREERRKEGQTSGSLCPSVLNCPLHTEVTVSYSTI